MKCCICEKAKEFLDREHTPLERGLMIATGVLAGVAIGLVISPIKNVICIGNDEDEE